MPPNLTFFFCNKYETSSASSPNRIRTYNPSINSHMQPTRHRLLTRLAIAPQSKNIGKQSSKAVFAMLFHNKQLLFLTLLNFLIIAHSQFFGNRKFTFFHFRSRRPPFLRFFVACQNTGSGRGIFSATKKSGHLLNALNV